MPLTLEEIEKKLEVLEDRNTRLETRLRREPTVDPLSVDLHELGWVPRCVLTLGSGQNITQDQTTPIDWDTVVYDPENLHSDSGNVDRIIIRTGGWYMCSASVSWTASGGGNLRSCWVNAVEAGGDHYFGTVQVEVGAGTTTRQQALGIWPMSVGDYFTVEVRQSEAGALTVATHAWSGSPTVVEVIQLAGGLPSDL